MPIKNLEGITEALERGDSNAQIRQKFKVGNDTILKVKEELGHDPSPGKVLLSGDEIYNQELSHAQRKFFKEEFSKAITKFQPNNNGSSGQENAQLVVLKQAFDTLKEDLKQERADRQHDREIAKSDGQFKEVLNELNRIKQGSNGSSDPNSYLIKMLIAQDGRLFELLKSNSNNGNNGGGLSSQLKDFVATNQAMKEVAKGMGDGKPSIGEVVVDNISSIAESALGNPGVQKALEGWGNTQTANALQKAEQIALNKKVQAAKDHVAKDNPGNPGNHAGFTNQDKSPTMEDPGQLSSPGVPSIAPIIPGGAEGPGQVPAPLPPSEKHEPGSLDEYAAMLASTPNNEETVPVSDSLIQISDMPSKGNQTPKTLDQEIDQKAAEMRAEAARSAEAQSFAESMARSDEQNDRKGINENLQMISEQGEGKGQ